MCPLSYLTGAVALLVSLALKLVAGTLRADMGPGMFAGQCMLRWRFVYVGYDADLLPFIVVDKAETGRVDGGRVIVLRALGVCHVISITYSVAWVNGCLH